MNGSRINYFLSDKGGRRTGINRRRFSYDAHIPERRSGLDRRGNKDRRAGQERRKRSDFTTILDKKSGRDRRRDKDRRVVFD
jgi:hypothetical protein